MKKFITLITLFSFFCVTLLRAQTTLSTTSAFTNNSGSGTVTFNFKNNNPYGVSITDIEGITGTAGTQAVEFWYKTTPVNGAPGAISVANGWTQVAAGSITGIANTTTTTTQPFFSGLSFLVPAGQTYGFAIFAAVQRYFVMVSDVNISNGGCSFISGTNIGYGGGTPPTAPTNSPRGWIGKITFVPDGPCIAPPIAGTVAATSNTVCAFSDFLLSLQGGTGGTGQSYQWQSSPDNSIWSDLGGGTNATLNTSQTASTWYRAIVTCGGISDTALGLQIVSPALVSGTYSINSSMATGGSNFQNFTDAVNHIKCGINGPVVFEVQSGSGPYNEQITIPQIGGASSTNTITFNGNGNTLIFNSSNTNDRAGITLNGADHVKIDSLTIDGTLGNFGWGILMTNRADSNKISRCTINVSNSNAISIAHCPIVISGSLTSVTTAGNNGHYDSIMGNTLNGGYYGIVFYGNSVANMENVGNVARNNKISDTYSYSIYLAYQSGSKISANDISRPARANSTTTGGVFMTTGNIGTLVEKNRIYNMFGGQTSSTSTIYGIYVSSDGTMANPNRLVNNLVYDINHNGITYGIYNTSGEYMQAYHNTISLDNLGSTAGATYGFYQTAAVVGIEFKNNIVSVTRGGSGVKYAIYKATATTPLVSNNNVLYVNSAGSGTQGIGWQTSAQTTLLNWQTTSGQDGASRAIDPLFVNASGGDFTPSEPSINDIGENLGIATDILNVIRTSSPDPGAYEFSLSGCTNPPVPGFAIASATTVCPGDIFTLNLSGNSVGAGQTYQWQLSPTGSAPWSNVGVPETNPLINTSQAVSYYYRAEVKCNAGIPVYSPSVQVISPVLVSGTFTINSALPNGAGNFQTFGDAVNSVKCGINGPVVFNVAPGSGPYVEQVVIPQVNGTSATNTITFNGNGATLVHTTTDGALRTAIHLNGADHIIFDSLMVDISGGTFGWGFSLTAQADSNTIRKCTIMMNPTSTTAANFIGIAVNGSHTATAISGNNGNGNKFMKNSISGGGYGFYLYGNSASSAQNNNNMVIGNTVTDFYNYGVYSIYQSSGLVISKNDFYRPNRTASTTVYGAFIGTGSIGVLVEKNKVHNLFDAFPTGTSATYGFWVASAGTMAAPNRIENNLVYNLGGNGSAYGIYNSTSPYMLAYHNTISLDGTSATTGLGYGIYQTGTAAGIDIRNNIINVTGTGTGAKRCLFFNTTANTIISNRNVLYMNAPAGTNNHVGQFGTTGTFNFTTLADWQTANSNAFDQQSVGVDPTFFNAPGGNYTPNTSLVNNIGTGVGVGTDILDTLRNPTDPDPGAYEFSTLTAGINMSAEGLNAPSISSSGCYTNAETITVRIRNNSTSTIDFSVNPVTVTVNVTGAATQTLMTTLTGGTLASDATLNVTMPVTLDMTALGVYTFNANTSVTGDVNPSNDAIIPVNRTKVALVAGSASGPTGFCAPNPILPTLNSTGRTGFSGLQWVQSNMAVGGYTPIAGGTTVPYMLGTAPTQTMYYKLVAICGAVTDSSSTVTISYNNPQVTGTTPGYTCGTGTVNLGATGSAGTTLNWYAASTGGAPIGNGTSFTTPVISATTNFYVSAVIGGGSGSVGLPNAISTTGYTLESGLFFDALTTFSIDAVYVYPTGTGAGTATIALQNSAGTTLQSEVVNLTGTAAPFVKTLVPLNFNVPIGNDYRLVMLTRTGLVSGLVRESGAGWGTYPLTFPGIVSITNGKCCPDAISTSYYYFYDWQVSAGCESARVPVLATVNNDPGCVPLPVSLLTFKGQRKGAINSLEWVTSTEINNSGFALERSADGNNFSRLVFVPSKANGGSSNTNLNYNFDDIKPLIGNGYYRLKQIDKDGKFVYSQVVLIKGSRSNAITLSSVYPNPTFKDLNLVINSPVSEKLNLVVTDLTGRIMLNKAVQTVSGDNIFNLQVDRLASGTYFIKAICANGCETTVQKFVKR